MKAIVVYDQDGTSTQIISGHRISVQICLSGHGVVKVYNKKSVEVRTYHYSKIYSIVKFKKAKQ